MSRVHDILVQFPEVAAGTDQELYVPLHLLSSKALVRSVKLISGSARTAHASNYTTISARNGATVIASRVTDVAGGNLVAGAEETLTLVEGARIVAEGDVLAVHKDDAGTGLAFDGAVMITLEEVPSP